MFKYKGIIVFGIVFTAGVHAAHSAQVFLTDVVVDGSLAVGVDATGAEIFGSDTIRLKENNLRIHFDDTSGTGSFPANDWRIVINDSANGGANYFAIEDSTAGRQPFRVEAGAPANALWVDNAGDVGIGEANPAVELHMADGDSPTFRLEQDASSGFTAQTWDIAGNEANFFVRDVTGGSKIPFKIKPGAPDNALFVAADGDIGLGTENPAAKLDVRGNAYIGGTLEIGSSRSLKENIHPLSSSEAMNAFRELVPVHYNYINDDENQLGFIAEDVPEILANKARRSLSPMDFNALLTRVVQEQQRRELELTEEVESLKARLSTLEKKLETGE